MLEPIRMSKVCSEHQIQLQRVCLHPDCTTRAMCLLCEHQHSPANHFRSIMKSQSLSYSVFASAIDTAIDCFLSGPTLNILNDLKTQTKNHINNYFTELSDSLVRLLQEKRKALDQEVDDPKESADKIISLLRQARASRSYLGASSSTFNLFKSIYDGAELAELLEDIDRRSVESIYQSIRKLHQEVSKFALSQQFSLHATLPTFSQPIEPKEPAKQIRKEESFFKPKAKGFVASLKSQSSAEFNSIISDSTRLPNNHLLVTSYDKSLRVFSPSLEQLAQFETENILTKILPLPSDEMFLVAHSKELLVQKIAYSDGQWTNSPVMALKGHAERIHSLAALNSRIILSASTEGVKVWDLYKEKCEFTFRDERGKNNPSCINLIKESKTLGVGCNGPPSLQLQSLETLKCFKKYALDGVPLIITVVDGCFYVGGFPSQLSFIDPRERKPVWSIDFSSDAVSCMSEINQGLLAVGFRDGTCREVDIKKRLVLADWNAHESRGSWSKPNGVVSIYARAQRVYVSVGCSDHLLRVFGVSETS